MTVNLILSVYKYQEGRFLMQGILTTGDIILLQSMMLQVMAPLNQLGQFMREFNESFVEIKTLYRILEEKPK